jgi:quinohemoprotein ethanol dehydrogenase
LRPYNDGRLEALDALTGKVVWEARVAYPQDNYTVSIAPRIARDKLIVGVSGGDRPTRGFSDAYDALTGRRAWRKAAATWDKAWWKNGGGGAVWDGIAYDPDAGLIY